MEMKKDLGQFKFIGLALALISWLFSFYIFVKGASIEAPIFLGLFGVFWFLIGTYSRTTQINTEKRSIKTSVRFLSQPIYTEDHAFDDFGAVLLKTYSGGPNAQIGRELDVQCYLVPKDSVPYFESLSERRKEQHTLKNHGELLTQGLSMAMSEMRTMNTQNADPGLLIKDVKYSRKSDCIKTAEALSKSLNVPLYDIT